jgi:hypothetical protein
MLNPMKLAAALALTSSMALPGDLATDNPTALGIGYICSAEHFVGPAGPATAVMLAGVGDGVWPADTKNEAAQTWFNEGLNLYHAFDHIEARAAFARAAALDPSCARCEWGVALALGPTLNYGVTAAETAQALVHADRAAALVKPGDDRAKDLIDALILRYGKDPKRDQLYARAMDELSRRYSDDDEIAVLAAHALMIPGRGDDPQAVGRAVSILKSVLARRPNDTAAIHYYIHATEFAGHPTDALPYAERLASLAPGASHLVHMGAHTLIHAGDYERVALVNAEALAVDAEVQERLGEPGPPSAEMYYLHNYDFGIEGALMSGDARLALKYADHAEVAFPASFDKGTISVPDGIDRTQAPADRRGAAEARALVALGRYDPGKALAQRDDPAAPRIVQVLRHYARGEAFAARGDAEQVRGEAQAIGALAAKPSPAAGAGVGDVAAIAAIAADVLEGRAALIALNPNAAIEAFTRAARRQEQAFPFAKNFDPPPWWYPVRRSLAYADLAAGKPADAAREAKTSLASWPNDALALRVLAEAEAKLGDARGADEHRAAARRAWSGNLDETPLPLT